MLKAYDMKCEECDFVKEFLIESKNGAIVGNTPLCEKCGGTTKRIYSKFNFKLTYDNKKDTCGWSFNNYESSHYWDDLKKQRQEGKDVKPINDK